MSERAIKRALVELVGLGFLSVERRKSHNIYTLTGAESGPLERAESGLREKGKGAESGPLERAESGLSQRPKVAPSYKEPAKEPANRTSHNNSGGVLGLVETYKLGGGKTWHFRQLEQVEAEWRIADSIGWLEALESAVIQRLEHSNKNVGWWVKTLTAIATEHKPAQRARVATDRYEVVE